MILHVHQKIDLKNVFRSSHFVSRKKKQEELTYRQSVKPSEMTLFATKGGSYVTS